MPPVSRRLRISSCVSDVLLGDERFTFLSFPGILLNKKLQREHETEGGVNDAASETR
jgi:hypothetical protein